MVLGGGGKSNLEPAFGGRAEESYGGLQALSAGPSSPKVPGHPSLGAQLKPQSGVPFTIQGVLNFGTHFIFFFLTDKKPNQEE